MHLASGYIDARTRSERLLLIGIVLRVGHSERPGQNKMGGKTRMFMGLIVSIPGGPKCLGTSSTDSETTRSRAVGPSEYV